VLLRSRLSMIGIVTTTFGWGSQLLIVLSASFV